MSCKRLFAVVTTLAMMASTATANPGARQRPPANDTRRIIGILEVHLDGVPKQIAKQFQANLEAKLDSRAYWLAPAHRMKDMLGNSPKWTDGCVAGPCLAEVKVQTGAEVVLLASITGSGTSFGYVVTLVRTDTGRYVAQESSRCDVCTVNEALTSATLAAVKLVTSLPDKLPDEESQRGAELAQLHDRHRATHENIKRHHRNIAIGLTLTGIVIAGAGFTAYFVKDRADVGLATAGGGIGLALGGVVALTF